MKRVLFIGHEASRSGAPIILRDFLQWRKENNRQYEADLLLLHDGELIEEYQKLIDVYVLPKSEKATLFRRGANFLKKKIKLKPKPPDLKPFSREYDLVLGNTLISLEYLKFFKQQNSQTICWLHELDYAVSLYSKEKFIELANYVDHFLVVSQAVKNMLTRFGIEKKIHLVYGFTKTNAANSAAKDAADGVKNELGIPQNAFVVGGSGTLEWRKGVDFFLQIASRLAARRDNFYFLWVGGKSPHSDAEYDRIRYDFERFDAGEKVIFTGMQKEPQRFFAAMDLFALTSREDPFPLVCLEAASLEKPLICFENAGGMPEFIGADAGAVVPYGDVEAFCEKLIWFYENPERRRQAGRAAREKLNSEFSADKRCAEINEVLLKAIAK